jgi:signal transduction histidine kinase
MDEYEVKNDLLIRRLNEKNLELENSNRELYELNKNIETQNEEIQAQSEELIQSQESLILAHNEIERQKLELEQHNAFLAKSLDEKNRDLLYSNQQLISQNNELQQFSYTVSHNLRGPVASMLGLVKVHALAKNEAEEKQILTLIDKSAQSLETIIRDLNKIIDIRNDKFSAFELVSLEQELLLIRQSLNAFIEKNDVQIEQSFTLREIISIKAYVNSILYNLVSNSIQYRSPDRQPLIRVSSTAQNGNAVLEVTDNGLGIDLLRYQGDLFKLYKRFHTHTQGKGLGLYLVKQQVEKLNGHIEVESKPNTGTTFRVVLPVR